MALEKLREEPDLNVQSEKGILKCQIRSNQTEGHFGDIKENEKFRRFNYRSAYAYFNFGGQLIPGAQSSAYDLCFELSENLIRNGLPFYRIYFHAVTFIWYYQASQFA